MADNQFLLGLLKGAYEGGIGNPEVNDRRRRTALEEAYTKTQMADEGHQFKTNVPEDQMGKVLAKTRSILFPGLGDSFSVERDPTRPEFGMNSDSEVAPYAPGSEMPEGTYRIPFKQGLALSSGQAARKIAQDNQWQLREDAREESKRKFREEQVSGFRDKLSNSESMKNYLQVKKYALNIEDAVKNPGAFGDLTLLYGYMRAIEPDSVVREGDQRLFQAAGSVSERAAGALNRLISGETLTQDQRNEVLKYTRSLKKNAFSSYDTLRKGAYKQAERNQLPINEIDPLHDEVIEDPFGGEQIREFKNLLEAEAAKLPKGSRITIGGRPATVQ